MNTITKALCWGVLGYSLSVGGVLAAGGAAEQVDPDQRSMLRLPPDERHMVLLEMRNFVKAIQSILSGMATKDYEAVADAARAMGSGAANEIPPRVVAKLPETFKQLAGKVHTTFDVIALDARDLGDNEHTVGQLSTLMQHCIACHSIYQVDREPFPDLKPVTTK